MTLSPWPDWSERSGLICGLEVFMAASLTTKNPEVSEPVAATQIQVAAT